jgi:hypothetical protein
MRAVAIFIVAAILAASAQAEQDPPVPAGQDPGGEAVALITTGIDYTRPEIASRLARDGEGEIMGWDFADEDRRPFDKSGGKMPASAGGDGTALAALLARDSRVRLVPVRVDPAEPASLARAVAFVAQTPAKLVVVPMWSPDRAAFDPFRQAALHFKDLLFFVAAGDDSRDIDKELVYPAGLGLDNAVVVSVSAAGEANTGAKTIDLLIAPSAGPDASGRNSREAAVIAARAAIGCSVETEKIDGKARKALLLARLAAHVGGTTQAVEACAPP